MIAYYREADGRGVRVFSRSERIAPAAIMAAVGQDFEDEDRARFAVLREILQQALVEGDAHSGVDPSDVCHVYLAHPSGPVFACVVVTQNRLRTMLTDASIVVEGFSLQVASGAHLTGDGLRAALEDWAHRNFPEKPAPLFAINPWGAPPEVEDPLDDGAPQKTANLSDRLFSEWRPDPLGDRG